MSDYNLMQAQPCRPDEPNQLCCVSDDGKTWFGPRVYTGSPCDIDGNRRYRARSIGEVEAYHWRYARQTPMRVIYMKPGTGQVECEWISAVGDNDSITLDSGAIVNAGSWKFLTPDLFDER